MTLEKMLESVYYRMFIFIIIMPINGIILINNFWIGFFLICCQIPWVIAWANK